MRLFFKNVTGNDGAFLYYMLSERDDNINISHHKMPDFNDHMHFLTSKPYKVWYIIQDLDIKESDTFKYKDWSGDTKELPLNNQIGNIYLTNNNEIGIFILKKYQNRGYGKNSIKYLQSLHNLNYYLANINPKNEASIALFKSLGYKHIQNTYKLENN